MDDNEKFELLREALLKIAYNNTKKLLSEYMKQINPDSYFPNATVEDLMIHIARQVVSMMDKKDGRNNYSFLEKKGKRYFWKNSFYWVLFGDHEEEWGRVYNLFNVASDNSAYDWPYWEATGRTRKINKNANYQRIASQLR